MKKLTRLVCALLCALILLPVIPASAAVYSDTGSHWARVEIDHWSALGIIEGSDGRFRPDDPITRAEMSVIIDRLMKYRTLAANTFSDVPQTWYTDAMLRANAAGVILGDGGRMRPADYITRQEAVVMLCRALGISEVSGATGFNDDYVIAFWARGYVNAMSRRGLIAGVGDGRFAPEDRITRASVVKLLDNSISAIYSAPGGYSGNASGSVIINASGVTLRNMSVSGDLIISEGVDNGGVSLNNVSVAGTVFVRGGGTGALELSDSRISVLQVERKNGAPGIYAAGSTSVNSTYITSSCSLEEAGTLSGAGFADVRADASSAIRVDLTGSFGRLTQNAAEADYRVNGFVSDISVLANCEFTGDFSYNTLDIASNAGCKINGELMTGSSGYGLQSLALVSSSADGAARVGDTLTAATITSGSVSIAYRWYWADSNLHVDSSGWTRISGAASKTYSIPSTMNGRYIKVEAEASGKTLSAKLSSYVGGSSAGTSAITVENYSATNSTKNESIVRFVFATPMAFVNSSGGYTAVENNYDFKYSASNWFSVRVGSGASSTDDSLIASAIYSTLDNSITVTLAGDAAVVKNTVYVKLNATVYDIYGKSIKAADCPTAVRTANCSSWQNGGPNGTSPLDTAPPSVTVSSAGNSSTIVRLVFNEPLGYVTNGVFRPVPNAYDFKNSAGTTGIASIKQDGTIAADSEGLVASAIYSANDRSVTFSLRDVRADETLTLAPLISFCDIYGNSLTPASAGVIYRRAGEADWYLAENQSVADAAASGEPLTGQPVIYGRPAKYGAELTIGDGTLSLTSSLTFSWYRSDDETLDETVDRLVGSGRRYTPVEADIGMYLLISIKSTSLPGRLPFSVGQVEKADAVVTAKTVTVNRSVDGLYNLANFSGLFETSSDGARSYRFENPDLYPSGSSIENGTLLKFSGTGEVKLQLSITGSTKYNDYTGSAVATLKIIDPAPRSIPVTVLAIPSGVGEGDLGHAWIRVQREDATNKVYIKNSEAPSNTTQGEALGRGDYFSGADYTQLKAGGTPSTGRDFTGSAIPGGSVAGAKGGTYYLVETNAENHVVSTGVVTIKNHDILAMITISNGCETKSIQSYSIVTSTSSTAVFTTQPLNEAFNQIFVPLDTTNLTLYVNTPSGSSVSGQRYSSSVKFDSCRAVVAVNDSLLK